METSWCADSNGDRNHVRAVGCSLRILTLPDGGKWRGLSDVSSAAASNAGITFRLLSRHAGSAASNVTKEQPSVGRA
jgi:hypothetical protein